MKRKSELDKFKLYYEEMEGFRFEEIRRRLKIGTGGR